MRVINAWSRYFVELLSSFPSMVIFQLLLRKFWFQTSHCLSVHPQVFMIKERCWFSQINFFVEQFPHRINVLFLSSQFLCHLHAQKRITLFHGVRRDIPNLELSPSHVSIGFSQIAFPIIVLPKDDHTDFAQEERLGLPYWTMILVICVDTPILEF